MLKTFILINAVQKNYPNRLRFNIMIIMKIKMPHFILNKNCAATVSNCRVYRHTGNL